MAIIYKFLTYESAFKVLESGMLKLAVLSDLNDAFDCAPNISFGPDMNLTSDEEEIKKREFIQSLEQNYGLLCFTEQCTDPLLWGHYANCSKGFALGFDFDSFGVPPGIKIPVRYETDRPQTLITQAVRTPAGNDQLTERIFGYKAPAWGYEREVRYLLNLELATLSSGIYYQPFYTCLKEVVVGYQNRVNLRYLGLLLKQKYSAMNVKIKLAKLHLAKYEMEIVDPVRNPFVAAVYV